MTPSTIKKELSGGINSIINSEQWCKSPNCYYCYLMLNRVMNKETVTLSWPKHKIVFVKANWHRLSLRQIAKAIDKSTYQVWYRGKIMGLGRK
jgi:hypothetical protein